jgi:hypothetical protein
VRYWDGTRSIGRGTVMRFSVLTLLVAAVTFLTGGAQAASSAETVVSTTEDGIRLTLIVPSHVYARNALLRLTVRVQNVSRHSVLTNLGLQCMASNPSVEVLDAHGNVTSQFPPHMWLPSCPFPFAVPLAAGRSTTRRVLFVLNGVAVRAVLKVGPNLAKRVITPRVAVGVSDTGTSALVVHKLLHGSVLVIDRPAHGRGPLYVYDSTYCGRPGGTASLFAKMSWTPTDGTRVHSACAGPQQWDGWAGFLNCPIVTIHYASPR